MKKIKNNLEKIIIRWLLKRGYIVSYDTINKQVILDYLHKNQYILKGVHTYQKGFVSINVLDDYIEIYHNFSSTPSKKTITYRVESITDYLKYFETINK